jgi:hypothetical protein
MASGPDYRAIARQAATAHGLDPHIFERQINAESNFQNLGANSAGAVGIAQFIPSTAASIGVNPRDPVSSLNGAAKLMAGYVKKYGGYENALRAYNAGEGAIQKSHGYGETNAYVAKILFNGRDPGKLSTPTPPGAAPSPRGVAPRGAKAATAPTAPTSVTTTTDNSAEVAAATEDNRKRSIVESLIAKHRGPDSLLISSGVLAPKAVPTLQTLATTRVTPGTPGTPGKAAPGTPKAKITAALTGSSSGGASAAVSWAKSTLGVSETNGANHSPRIDQWQKAFGLSGAPWCAIFTSLATTKGGVAKSGRTASVAEVRRQAQNGTDAYQRGFVDPKQARAGDLILFGNDHIGLVESVGSGGITMIAGNDSNKVQQRTVGFGSGDIVRPRYRGK